MMQSNKHIRHGLGSVRPYLHGPADLPIFLQKVFGARELERHAFGPDSAHVELQIGDGVVVVEAGALPPEVSPWQGSVYVYVEDVDAVYHRALELGATSVAAPEDKPYQERQAGFKDGAGNTWWIGRYRGST
jgi:PhnB protein